MYNFLHFIPLTIWQQNIILIYLLIKQIHHYNFILRVLYITKSFHKSYTQNILSYFKVGKVLFHMLYNPIFFQDPTCDSL